MRPELIPLLVVALLLLSAGGADVERVEVLTGGEHAVDDLDHPVIVGDATLRVTDGAAVSGPIYVIAGETRIDGTVEGDVVQLAGDLSVGSGGSIDGELRLVGGTRTIDPGASIARRTTVEPAPADPSLAAELGAFVLQALMLGLAGFWLGRRHPTLLGNVGDSVTEHGLVSVTDGAIAGLTALALFVFIAFTLLLLPVSVLGLLVGLLVVLYGFVAFGFLLGHRLPVEDVGLATAAGTVIVLTLVFLLPRVPVVGSLVGLVLGAAGIGAVLLSYFGLRDFEPASLPE